MRSFCSAKASLIFSTKNISEFGYKVIKHLIIWPLNELVKLTMLWTTGPRFLCRKAQLPRFYVLWRTSASVLKCLSKWLHFVNQWKLFQMHDSSRGSCLWRHRNRPNKKWDFLGLKLFSFQTNCNCDVRYSICSLGHQTRCETLMKTYTR